MLPGAWLLQELTSIMGARQVLERTPALTQLDPATMEQLASVAVTRRYARGAYLWRAGEQPVGLVVLGRGLVKITRALPRGRVAIVGLFGAPGTVGELALIKGVAYPANAIVATAEAHVLTIPRANALTAIRASPNLALGLSRSVQEKVSMLHDKIDVLSAGSVESRMASLLVKLYAKFGDDFDDGTSRLAVALSRQELADLVSTSFETAIRVMTRWERQLVVTTDADGFTLLNLDLLRAAAGMHPDAERSHR